MDTESQDLLKSIIEDREHGSTQIALNLLNYISEKLHNVEIPYLVGFLEDLERKVMERRSLILPSNILHIFKENVKALSKLGIEIGIEKIVSMIRESYINALNTAVKNAVDLLEDFKKIFTLSYSSQVFKILVNLREVDVYIVPGWPVMDGLKMYRELALKNINVKLYPDLSIGEAVTKCDLVLLGSDAVLSDSSLVNRTGSRVAAMIAKENELDVYSVTDSLKLDFRSLWIPETWVIEDNVKLEFEIFEVVEDKFVDGYISEMGLDHPEMFVEKSLEKLKDFWLRIYEKI
ncbi:MAG: hypothetical protein QW655_05175 [Nitrososphaerota archaeon]|nr:hypothetical protein [Candidatus Geocrenenecus dongiae]